MNFFIDSNIIIESLKEEGLKEAYDIMNLLMNMNLLPFVNFVVLNEAVFILHYKKKLLELEEVLDFLNSFIKLPLNELIEELAVSYMRKYKLKPNDALILATCKHYEIPYLISLDSDFKKACKKEGIVLVDSVEKLKDILK